MIRSLRTSALGMSAQQLKIDNISNNLANVNTTGYKKSSVAFQDLMYETLQSGEVDRQNNKEKPGEIQIGMGNKPVSSFRSFSQGEIKETGNPLDVAINGSGFFQILRSDGTYAYTRDGNFRLDPNGNLVTSSGLTVYPEQAIPEGATGVKISEDGIISVKFEGQHESEEVGQIELANFMNPSGLKSVGGNLYEKTEASGEPLFGMPGDQGFGTLQQGYLEKSNVDVVKEMVNLIVAQRTYEINSKAVKTADEILAMTNNLKR
ncbi:MAG TPA: flagellar basal-body rod protein FlgG [bacterium]|nr:flagellar basal-body rod protein FlgG [bacterium]